jgi:hypothetical protein
MSLLITATKNKSRQDLQIESSLHLNDDGYYWFLHPAFIEIKESTGQMIDLYSEAVFGSSSLPLLREFVARVEDSIRGRPDHWQVSVGHQLQPEIKEMLDEISKPKLIELLKRFIEIIDFAVANDENVICIGD